MAFVSKPSYFAAAGDDRHPMTQLNKANVLSYEHMLVAVYTINCFSYCMVNHEFMLMTLEIDSFWCSS